MFHATSNDRHARGTLQTTSLSSESKTSSASCRNPPVLFMAWALVGCCIKIATQHAAWAAAAASSSPTAAVAVADDRDGADLLEPPLCACVTSNDGRPRADVYAYQFVGLENYFRCSFA